MCGRFASYKNQNKLKNIFNIINLDFNNNNSYNISPGQEVNIILRSCIDGWIRNPNSSNSNLSN